MTTCDRMVMIGAAGRNVGKTEFACRLIARYRESHRVVGVKITTVEERDGTCPRGGEGCGVCSALESSYCLTEEGGDGDKDTARMVQAGADRVFWLRVLKEHLDEGISALLDRIPEDSAVICESNSARLVLKPGVFIVVKQKGESVIKPSCSDVMDHADAVVQFDGSGWDFQPSRVVFTGNGWRVRPLAGAVILAGGSSRRMGQDKAMLTVDGRPLISHVADQLIPVFDDVIIGADDVGKYGFTGLKVIPDEEPGLGPLMGIKSCLQHSEYDLNFIIGCDIPAVNLAIVMDMLRRADGYDIVMPRLPDGKTEPLFAVYMKSVVEAAGKVLERGGRRVVDLFDSVHVKFVEIGSMDWYRNLNTMEDYREAFGDSEGRREISRQ